MATKKRKGLTPDEISRLAGIPLHTNKDYAPTGDRRDDAEYNKRLGETMRDMDREGIDTTSVRVGRMLGPGGSYPSATFSRMKADRSPRARAARKMGSALAKKAK